VKTRASAPAKVILLREHFVVYDKPAIVIAIDRRADAAPELGSDKAIYITSNELEVSGYFRGETFEAEKGGPEAQAKRGMYNCAGS